MPIADIFGGGRDVEPFVQEAWQRLPVVNPKYLTLFADLIAKHWNAGNVWRAILKDAPADFLRPDAEAVERENFDFDPDDEDDEPTYRSAREDFEELCLGVSRLLMRAVHAERNAGLLLDRYPMARWTAVPAELDGCAIARRNDGRCFERESLPPQPDTECGMRFCGCLWQVAKGDGAGG